MIAFIIFFAGLVAIGIVLSICNFFSETYQEVKEKERYDLEQKKKQDEFALEAQRKKAEQELESIGSIKHLFTPKLKYHTRNCCSFLLPKPQNLASQRLKQVVFWSI